MNITGLIQLRVDVPTGVTTGTDIVEAITLPADLDWTKLAWPLTSVYVSAADLANMAYLPYISPSWDAIRKNGPAGFNFGVGLAITANITTAPVIHTVYSIYCNLVFTDQDMPVYQLAAQSF